jgi:hypothetical protein
MVTFFVRWPLWEQMTFVGFFHLKKIWHQLMYSRSYSGHWYEKFGYKGIFTKLTSQALTLVAGSVKNMYAWRRDRHYTRIISRTNVEQKSIPQDVEARGMAMVDEVPFGVKALQQGVEVEGIWISQPNTPAPSSPVMSAQPSPVPSLVGGKSPASFPSGNTLPPELVPSDYSLYRASTTNSSRVPSFALDSVHYRYGGDSDDQIHEYASTLDALEGRMRALERSTRIVIPVFHDTDNHAGHDDMTRYYSRSSQRSRSRINSARNDGSSFRDSSPSPPTLTDGASRSETPGSAGQRGYLSESNHRLSHVAETGQLHPRVRVPKFYDNMTITSSDASSSCRSTMHLPIGGPICRATSRLSSSSSPPSPIGSTFTEPRLQPLYVPRPVALRQPSFDLNSIQSDSIRSTYSPRHSRAFSNSQVIAGQQPSPILVEYMSRSLTEESNPAVRDFPAGHRLNRADITRSSNQSIPPPNILPLRPLPNSGYRRVNLDFEIDHRVVGSLDAPLELPSLEPYGVNQPRKERRKSRKLQKKRSRPISIG